MTTTLPALPAPRLDAEIADLVADLRAANGPVMAVMNRLGGTIERQLSFLPDGLRREAERGVAAALSAAFALGGSVPDLGRRGGMAAAVLAGAAGGAGGLATAVAELPLTVAVLLKAIREEAMAAGFDPAEPAVQAACIEVFAAGAPLAGDEGVNTSFVSARLTVTGPALQKIISTVAPRLVAALGPKLAAQAVPVLGALGGAALNAAYLSYYRELARIRFQLMRMTVQYGAEAVMVRFRAASEPPRLTRSAP